MHPKKLPFTLAGVALLALLLIAHAAVAVGQRGVLVVVKNSGSRPMSNVLVILGGKQIALGDIAAGASARGRVVPVADSDVAISFADGTAATQVVRVDTYVTNGIKGKVDADVADGQLKGSKADLSVSIL